MDEPFGAVWNESPLVQATVGERSPSSVVVSAVAAVADVAVAELPPLYERVDPDALDELFAGGGGPGRAAFRYAGYVVAVTADGRVRVHEHPRSG